MNNLTQNQKDAKQAFREPKIKRRIVFDDEESPFYFFIIR